MRQGVPAAIFWYKALEEGILRVTATALLVISLFSTISIASEHPWKDELSPDIYESLAEYGSRNSRAELETSLHVIDPGRVLRPFLRWTDREIEIRSETSDEGRMIRIPLRPADATSSELSIEECERPFRVVLDAGHFGGEWSKTEWRHVQDGSRDPVREGTLAWGVARVLKDLLSKAGVDVRLSREAPPATPFPKQLHEAYDPQVEASLWLGRMLDQPPYSDWLKEYPGASAVEKMEQVKKEQIEKEPFALYNSFDLRRRGTEFWEFAPDLTLSIHFNAKDEAGSPWTSANGVMVILPGNLQKEDAGTAAERFYHFRRWLEGSTPEAIALAKDVSVALQKHLSLGPMKAEHLSKDQRLGAIPIDRGHAVFAQNLAILRRTRGTVLLVEGPFTNNREEYERLIRRDIEIDGEFYPIRVKEYAESLFEVVAKYAQLRQNNLSKFNQLNGYMACYSKWE